VTDQPNDQGQFVPLQQKVESNLSKDPNRAYTGDAGYHNLEDLEHLENNKVDALIADPAPDDRSTQVKPTSADLILSEKRKIERTDFVYHIQGDYYECPNGDHLTKVKNKGKSNVYRAGKCTTCPLAIYCLASKKNYKQIHRSKREIYAERMAVKLQTNLARQRMHERRVSVEPVFGNLKENLGFRRFSLSGLNQVKSEFTLMAIAHNLNILFKKIDKERLAAAISRSYEHIAFSKNILVKLYCDFTTIIKLFNLSAPYKRQIT
jgi:transposase